MEDVYLKGGVCNSADIYSNIQFGGKSRSIQLLVTVQGNKAQLWDSRPLAVKLTTKSDISINNGIFH